VAEAAHVDALDERSVDEHADAVAATAGAIDISFNLISHGDVHGTPLVEMALEESRLPGSLGWQRRPRHRRRHRLRSLAAHLPLPPGVRRERADKGGRQSSGQLGVLLGGRA
jgi:hypothetical protein